MTGKGKHVAHQEYEEAVEGSAKASLQCRQGEHKAATEAVPGKPRAVGKGTECPATHIPS